MGGQRQRHRSPGSGEIDKVAENPDYQVRFRLFNTADGVAGVPFSEGSRSGLRSSDGRLWFITSSGVTIVDPRTIGEAPAAPSARIESVAADTRSFDPASAAAASGEDVPSADRVHGPHAVGSRAGALSLSPRWLRPGLGGRRFGASGHVYESPASSVSVSGHGERRRRQLGRAELGPDVRHPADVLPDALVLRRLRVERVRHRVRVVAAARSPGAPPVRARARGADSHEPRHSRHAAPGAGRACSAGGRSVSQSRLVVSVGPEAGFSASAVRSRTTSDRRAGRSWICGRRRSRRAIFRRRFGKPRSA